VAQQNPGTNRMVFKVIGTTGEPYEKVMISGQLQDDSGWLMHEELMGLFKKNGLRLLLDVTELEGRSTILGTILRAEQMRREHVLHAAKVAVLDLPLNQSSALDSELVLSNRGLPIRYFFSEEQAIRWLKEK
jgi:hypothetical protein